MPSGGDRFDRLGLGMSIRDHAMLARAPRLKPERQWWNLPAKIARADQIAREELERARAAADANGVRPHNNSYDAMRHARWSQRMAQDIGPRFARLAGVEHEIKNVTEDFARAALYRATGGALEQHYIAARGPTPRFDQTLAETGMDMANNAVGLRAAHERRPVDPADLAILPGPIRSYPVPSRRSVRRWR